MFPIPFNFPFRKKDGSLSTIGDEIGGGGGSSYTLPTASANVKGGVKIGAGLTMDGEVLKNINPTPATPYTLPTASGETLGGVKVGTGLSIDENGVLSASGGGGSTLYEHYITMSTNESSSKQYNFTIRILNKTSTVFTLTTLMEFLYDNNFRSKTTGLMASGGYNDSGTAKPVMSIFAPARTGSLNFAYASNSDVIQSISTSMKIMDEIVLEV